MSAVAPQAGTAATTTRTLAQLVTKSLVSLVPPLAPSSGADVPREEIAHHARAATGYRFRFGFEQAAVDQFRGSAAPVGEHNDAQAVDARVWQSTTALALRVAREISSLGGP